MAPEGTSPDGSRGRAQRCLTARATGRPPLGGGALVGVEGRIDLPLKGEPFGAVHRTERSEAGYVLEDHRTRLASRSGSANRVPEKERTRL